MLLFQLATSFTLLPFDAFPLRQGQHLLVLHPQLPTLQFKVVQMIDNRRRLFCRGEVCKSQASEDPVIEVIIEGIGERQVHIGHELHQLFLLRRKWDVLDHDRRGDELLIGIGVESLRSQGGMSDVGIADPEVGVGGGKRRMLIKPGLEKFQGQHLRHRPRTQGSAKKQVNSR